MAAIDNYFPLKILKNALDKEEDVAEDDNAGIVYPALQYQWYHQAEHVTTSH